MSEDFGYIDSYFQKQLSESERKAFEERCVSDKDFADDVAFYISSNAAARELLLDQKKKEWSSLNATLQQESTQAPVKRMNFKKWLPLAAAACVIVALLVLPFFNNKSPRQLTAEYIKKDLSSISQTMDASRDTLQTGIAAFNNQKYDTALKLFQAYLASHPESSSAIKYIGQTYLLQKSYDQAINHFDQLSSMEGLFSNPGLFLKALTLTQRNKPQDLEQARQLFQKVADEKLDGEAEARNWLKDWPQE